MDLLAIVAGYLIGSIPFGLLAGFLLGVDVRESGSGNIGATNVVRVCGWRIGLSVFVLDVLKGFAPVFWIFPLLGAAGSVWGPILSGVAAILGHNFPLWLRFRGGKGVATSAGVVGALMPLQLAVALGVFLLAALIWRYVSLGSMLASAALVVAQLTLGDAPFAAESLPRTGLAGLLCVLVVVRHRANIGRLLAGTESRIGESKKPPAAESEDAGASDETESADG